MNPTRVHRYSGIEEHLLPEGDFPTQTPPPKNPTLDRRMFLSAGIGGVLGAMPFALQTRACAQENPAVATPAPDPAAATAPPVVDARFPAEIADGVFLLPDRRVRLVPNIGIVVGSHTVLVVDCGLGAESGSRVLEAVRQIAGRRKIVLTLTHAHPEHGFGAQAFRGAARIYYNRLQHEYLERAGKSFLVRFRPILGPERAHLLDDVRITMPDATYDGKWAQIDLGGRVAELRTWGTAHTPGDQAVFLPKERILFAGDLVEERIFPIVPLFPPMTEASDIHLGRWRNILVEMARLRPRIVVPGHGNLGGTELLDQVGGYFATVRAGVERLRAEGANPDEIVKRLEPEIAAKYPTWEWRMYVALAIRYYAEGHP